MSLMLVDSKQWRHCIGAKLLEWLIGAARNRDLEFLMMWPNEASVPFYRREGFCPASDVHVGADDEPPFELVLASTVAIESSVTS